MKSALAAFKFLSIARHFDSAQLNPRLVGHGAPYFPLVGLIFGLILAIVNRALEPLLESEILGVVLVTLLIVMTGAIHLEGMQKTFDNLSAEANSGNRQSQPIGVYGLLALLLVVLFKIRSVEVIGETRTLSLLLTPVFARWSLVIFLYGSTSTADEPTRVIALSVKTWHLLITTAATLLLATYLAGRTGLWIGLCLSLLALLGRSYLHRHRGGLTRDHLGALIELGETLSFILFASL